MNLIGSYVMNGPDAQSTGANHPYRLDVGICLIVNEVYIDADVRENVYLMNLNLSVSFFFFSFYVNSSKITLVFDGPTNL